MKFEEFKLRVNECGVEKYDEVYWDEDLQELIFVCKDIGSDAFGMKITIRDIIPDL